MICSLPALHIRRECAGKHQRRLRGSDCAHSLPCTLIATHRAAVIHRRSRCFHCWLTGEATQFLLDWLQLSLPKASKKSTFELGVLDSRLAAHIKDSLSTPCVSTQLTDELLRGVRLHFTHYIKALKQSDLHQAQLGLSHAYSRSKVKFNVHRVDNMIIQAIALLDQLDKDLNTFTMRVREWYSWHFPELYAIVPDSLQFAQCCRLIQNKSTLTAPSTSGPLLDSLESVLEDGDRAKTIVEAAKMSMGTDISPIDLVNIEQFASRCIELGLYRKSLHAYLVSKMNLCAPNLSALIGEQVGARLISHAGSLTNLAKYPASTVQILGAEKALFRALKTKGSQPQTHASTLTCDCNSLHPQSLTVSASVCCPLFCQTLLSTV